MIRLMTGCEFWKPGRINYKYETFEKQVRERSRELLDAQQELEKAKRLSDIGALAATVASRRIAGPEDFEAIAKDPAWAARNVDYRRLLQGPNQPFSRKVGAEVVKLKVPGDTTRLIEDIDGFFLATYAGERPAENVSFAEAREELRQRYYTRWRAQRLDQLTRKLTEGHHVESHPQLLNQRAPGS